MSLSFRALGITIKIIIIVAFHYNRIGCPDIVAVHLVAECFSHTVNRSIITADTIHIILDLYLQDEGKDREVIFRFEGYTNCSIFSAVDAGCEHINFIICCQHILKTDAGIIKILNCKSFLTETDINR